MKIQKTDLAQKLNKIKGVVRNGILIDSVGIRVLGLKHNAAAIT